MKKTIIVPSMHGPWYPSEMYVEEIKNGIKTIRNVRTGTIIIKRASRITGLR